MFDFLYLIIISPIEIIIETACTFFLVLVRGNYGLAIIGVSIVVSVLCLPLYAQAEHLQRQEREIQQKLEKRKKSIRKNFKGDEQYMILSAYYRLNHYHPLMALRSSMSLLIQIPFFIAAYYFLSGLEVLNGAKFFIISDLGAPDGLLSMGAMTINVLPVLMTVINIISGIIYAKGFPLREKVQLYGIATIFLVLLYNSPSALVIYWTCNNIFSLVKNIIYQMKDPKKIIKLIGICCLLGLVLTCIYVLFFRSDTRRDTRRITLGATLFLVGIPLYLSIINKTGKKYLSHLKNCIPDLNKLFLLSCIAIWILCGIFIPFNVVASDPAEFSFLTASPSPFVVLLPAIFLSFGLFLVWPVYIYYLAPQKIRIIFSFIACVVLIAGLVNTFGFQGDYGVLTKTLVFPLGTSFSGSFLFWVGSIIVCGIIAITVSFLYKLGKIKLLSSFMIISCLAVATISAGKGFEIRKGYEEYRKVVAGNEDLSQKEKLTPVLQLSRSGKNVVVIMLDKASSAFLPVVLKEREDIKKALSGFVYYPNTVSFFRATLFGSPPFFGGYEYTPEKMHERKDVLLRDKHNEALLLLPTLFQNEGYKVSVFDLPLFNYQDLMDTSFFTAKGINAGNLMGKYDSLFLEELGNDAPFKANPGAVLRRNFPLFSLFMIAPPIVRSAIYRNGSYWNVAGNDNYDLVQAIHSYSVLHYLPVLTKIKDEGNTLTLMANELAHKDAWFQYPDYTVKAEITDFGTNHFDGHEATFKTYHSFIAAFLLLSKWFDVLRENSVYDNTRIIIAADHDTINFHPSMTREVNKLINMYNPLLMIKDFNDNDAIRTDMRFMTNADVPLLVLQNLVESPKNPFTGKDLQQNKENGVNILLNGSLYARDYRGSYQPFNNKSEFRHVKDNIFDTANWTQFLWKE